MYGFLKFGKNKDSLYYITIPPLPKRRVLKGTKVPFTWFPLLGPPVLTAIQTSYENGSRFIRTSRLHFIIRTTL